MLMFTGVALDPLTAGKVLAVSAVVYAALQAIKKTFPAVSGWWAVALNVGLSIGGVLAVVPVEQVLSLSTLTAVLTAAIAAAGIHGSVQNLGPQSAQTPKVVATTVSTNKYTVT
jgi:hypothetical protein